VGELRNSILEMGKQVAAAAKTGDQVAVELEAAKQRASKLFERLYAGHDVLYLYLEAMFEKNNRKLKDYESDKLSQHADSEILTYLKGIDQAANETLAAIKDFDKIRANMPGEYEKIDALAVSIKRNIDKKRSKFLNSKKYKAKLATYEKALGELTVAIDGRRKAFNKLRARNPKSVEDLRLKPTSKISDVRSISVKNTLDVMKQEVEEGTYVARKFHENGDLKNAFAQMKQWAGEADAMDAEVLALDPDAAKPIKDVKIFHAKKLVATAAKATYQGKRPMEIPAVKWAKGVDYLALLQKPITLQAKAATGGGDVSADMKINGIKGDTVKLV
jgi:hypothetical protein